MVNPKRKKFHEKIKNISDEKLGDENLLSYDLEKRVGSLEEKTKITIRLDARVIDEAKKEAKELGVGYQKIINDRLLEIYGLESSSYLEKSKRNIEEELKSMRERIEKLEKKQA